MKTIRTLKDYFTGLYGHAIQRIPLDLGLSCPRTATRRGMAAAHSVRRTAAARSIFMTA